MKHLILSLIATAFVCGGLSLTPLHADETWSGGNGTWDFNTTQDWSGSNWTTNAQAADFTSTPGTVTVDNSDGQVGADFLYFNSSSTTSAWDITGGALYMSIAGGGNNLIYYQDGNSGTVTVDSAMNIDTSLQTDRYNIFSNAAATTIINGNVTIEGQATSTFDQYNRPNNTRSLIIGSSNNAAVFDLNGVFSDSYNGTTTGGVAMQLRLAEGGATQDTYFINGDVSGMHAGISIGSGNVVVDPTANLGTGQIGLYDDQGYPTENVAIYGAKGATITNNVYISMKYEFDSNGNENPGNGIVGAYDASDVTFSGGVGLDNSGAILTAAANGRADFSGGDIGNHSPNGLYKTGAGVVVLGTNNYNISNDFTPNTTRNNVLMDVQQGTLLANNTSGSAFGSSTGNVLVEAGATLGGKGGTVGGQQVIAEAATSVIAPGDSGQANLGIKPSIATLTLAGGLSAANGLTMNFKLTGGLDGMVFDSNILTSVPGPESGVDNDFLQVSSFTLGAGKTVTVNLTALDALATGTDHEYTLFSDSNADAINPADFDIIAPTGYALDSSYGGDGTGGGYDYTNGVLTVQLVATPEPSTWAMMCGGLVLLAVRLRRKLARQIG